MADNKLTKTDRFINLFVTLLQKENGCISDAELRAILGNPSKSQYHKYLLELTQDKTGRSSFLSREKVKGGFLYRLRELLPENSKAKERPKLVLLNNQKFAEIKVFDDARNSISEEHLPITLMSKGDGYDVYKCAYDNEQEFLRNIFAYADDIEVISPKEIRDQFIQKAQKAAFLNMNNDYKKKSA